MSEEQTQAAAVQDEKDQEQALVSISSEYTDVEIERGFGTDRRKLPVRIRRPRVADRHAASRYGKSLFVQCLKDGVPTRSQAIEAARTAGLWSDESEQRMADLNTKIESLINDQRGATNKATKAKIRQKIRDLKREQLELASRFTDVTRNTLESIQDDAEQSFLLVKTVYVLDGDKEIPYYKSVDALNNEIDVSFVERLTNAASSFWLGDVVLDFLSRGELLDEETSGPGTE